MTGSATVALGYLPVSFNATGHAHWSRSWSAKQALQRDLEFVMLATPGLPRPIPGGRVQVSAVLLVPDRRRRDAGNFRTPLEKACGDALVNGGWLPDDTPEHFEFGDLVFEVAHGTTWLDRVSATRLHLTWAARSADFEEETGPAPVRRPAPETHATSTARSEGSGA